MNIWDGSGISDLKYCTVTDVLEPWHVKVISFQNIQQKKGVRVCIDIYLTSGLIVRRNEPLELCV